ncbi:MAG: hypothetical protein HRU35_04125 [Rickettsiaceae bacterium]|nr:hypothetical protein [Rickettsiaceae bacterium]
MKFNNINHLYLKKKVKQDVAMTGEITLYGELLPVGGIKEKLAAAVRSGIKTVIMPEDNAKDLAKLPEDIKQHLEIKLLSNYKDILNLISETNN